LVEPIPAPCLAGSDLSLSSLLSSSLVAPLLLFVFFVSLDLRFCSPGRVLVPLIIESRDL